MSQALFKHVQSAFEKHFSLQPLLIASPGRINLIGEHIDYSGGFVFPAAIDKYIVCALEKSTNKQSKIIALDLDESLEFSVESFEKLETGHWGNYILGVVNELQKAGHVIENFNLVFGGNIPIGAGLSSSAALENGVGYALNERFNLKIDKISLLKHSMQAEHNFAGVLCGVMDQFASMMGKKDNALYLNCGNLSFTETTIETNGYQFILINSNVKHTLSDSPYNERKNQCKTGFDALQNQFPELAFLCEANMDQLNSIKNDLSEIVYQRCAFAIQENERVKSAKIALEKGALPKFGTLLYESHEGLQNKYEVSCMELDFLVDLTKSSTDVLGARMMGGGFGGCTINLIKQEAIDSFILNAKQKFSSKFGHSIDVYSINITDGTKLIEL